MQPAGDLALLADDGDLVVEADVVQYRLQKQAGHADQMVVLLSLEERISRRVLTYRQTDILTPVSATARRPGGVAH